MVSIFLFILSYPLFHFLGKWDNWVTRGVWFSILIYVSTYIYVDRYIHLSRHKLSFDVETKEEPFLHVPGRILKGMGCGDILAFKLCNRLKAELAQV